MQRYSVYACKISRLERRQTLLGNATVFMLVKFHVLKEDKLCLRCADYIFFVNWPEGSNIRT